MPRRASSDLADALQADANKLAKRFGDERRVFAHADLAKWVPTWATAAALDDGEALAGQPVSKELRVLAEARPP